MTRNPQKLHLRELTHRGSSGDGSHRFHAVFECGSLPDHDVEMLLIADEDDLFPCSLSLRPAEGFALVTTALLRHVPVTSLVNLARQEIAARGLIRVTSGMSEEDTRQSRALVKRLADMARPGRRERDDAFYVGIAVEYLMAMRDSATAHRPLRAVAEKLNYSAGTIGNLLARAEALELIANRVRGRPGLTITEKGIRALEIAISKKISTADQRQAEEQTDGIH